MSDNKTLQARLRARERAVTVKGHVYTIRRPRAAEMMVPMTGLEMVCRFTVGWDLKTSDLVPGGLPDPEPFDPALFRDYVEDDVEMWQPLVEAIREDWGRYVAAQGEAEKN